MTVIADYTAEEQTLLRSGIQSAAVAISAASPGRSEETVSEGFAAADFVLASQPRYVDNPLVTSMLVKLQEELQHEHLFPNYVHVATAPAALEDAMGQLRKAADLVDATATPQEAAGYKRWLLDIAQVVAQAGKEDQGFLGIGGVLVNDRERAAYQAIADALGAETSTD